MLILKYIIFMVYFIFIFLFSTKYFYLGWNNCCQHNGIGRCLLLQLLFHPFQALKPSSCIIFLAQLASSTKYSSSISGSKFIKHHFRMILGLKFLKYHLHNGHCTFLLFYWMCTNLYSKSENVKTFWNAYVPISSNWFSFWINCCGMKIEKILLGIVQVLVCYSL